MLFYVLDSNLWIQLMTSAALLVEASPKDVFWGVGHNKLSAPLQKHFRGRNQLGVHLMELRSFFHHARMNTLYKYSDPIGYSIIQKEITKQ